MKHIVSFSGGADSQACALWVRRNFPVEDIILCNADPGGNEAPETVEFIDWYSTNIFPVHVIHPKVRDMGDREKGKIAELGLKPDDPLTFDLMALIKGMFPTTKSRFCTTHLKLEPMRRWCYEQGAHYLNTTGQYDDLTCAGPLSEGYARYVGVRRDESDARSLVDEHEYDDYFLCQLHRPLATWTKAQVFDDLIQTGEPFNPLYLKGFSRVGCAPCINSGKEDVRLWAAYAPAMIAKIDLWEQRVGRTFFPPLIPTGVKSVQRQGEDDKTFKKRKKSEGRRHGFIHEVVAWSRTMHGGKQPALPILEADVRSGVCMSKYGLCE